MTETAQASPKKAAKQSEYVVLRKTSLESVDEAKVTWKLLGSFKGSSAHQAVKEAAKVGSSGDAFEDGEYVAVPARSFRPVKLATTTETRVTLS